MILKSKNGNLNLGDEFSSVQQA